ncbi:MAG: sugar phosphate isomerase/epimerase [Victivallales bacterium]|nr:sugar phosphate isomerase/epimerase [Victivallales bacterium]
MLIGVSSYSYSRLVRSGAMKQIDVIAKAKEMGFDCIEFSTIAVPEGKTLPEFAAELRAEADRLDFPIMNYTIGADLLGGSNGDLDAEIERVKGEVDIAAILRVPGMRHDATYGNFPADWKGPKSFDAALPRLAAGCRAITEYAATKGIKTMVENHGYFCQESLRVERLITAVNHPNFGALIDIGNFICADDNPAQAVGRLAPFAFHCHAKDFHLKSGMEPWPGKGWNQSRSGNWWRGAILGHGNVPVAQIVRNLIAKGYDGVFSIEFEGMEDVLTGIEYGQANLRRFIELAKAQMA